jgi:hypothetical protein
LSATDSVFSSGKNNFVSTTISFVSSEQNKFGKEKSDKGFDLATFTADTKHLSMMYFELFNT